MLAAMQLAFLWKEETKSLHFITTAGTKAFQSEPHYPQSKIKKKNPRPQRSPCR
uniref:Uncharacterized protein n=1 Tax=Arundo donax TaxID=35708 RepID=A0A0A9A302_ARUDO